MMVKELASLLQLEPVVECNTEREVGGGYAGDLLSWVMGRAHADDIWVTIMSNANILAVATLADVSAIVLAEGVSLDEGVADTARAKEINIYRSALDTFQLCGKITAVL